MLSEGAELIGETGKTYLAVSPLGQANVWTAVDVNDPSHIVVIKEPGEDDTRPGWPSFQHEMVMHELLKDSDSIRKQVDRILPTREGEPPMLVLEIFETTLWTARAKRPFTTAELKSVTKDTLIGLIDVHKQGLVYADLKMQNIMVDGFDTKSSSNDSNLTATLGDLGIVMAPATGKVQPVSYRAPEVYFKGEITSKADIWGWGLIYCHLLEARNRFSKTGLYDDLETATGSMFEREQAVRSAISNDYKISNNAYYDDVPLPPKDDRTSQGDQWEELRRRGLEDGEVDFLRWVMRADPRKRPSAQQILDCGWLDKNEEQVATGFQVPANGVGESSMEYDPTRSPDVTAHQAEAHGEVQETLGGNGERQGRKPSVAEGSSPGDQAYHTNNGVPPTIKQGQYASIDATTSGVQAQAQDTPSSARPTHGERTRSAINDAMNDVYAGRASFKRQLSHPDENPGGKKAYTPGLESSTITEYTTQNASTAPVQVEPTPDTNMAVESTAQPPVRPGFSTHNTGTFLSYR